MGARQISVFQVFSFPAGVGGVKIWPGPDVTAATPTTHLCRAPEPPLSDPVWPPLGAVPAHTTGHAVAPGALPVPQAATVTFFPWVCFFVVPQACSGGVPLGHGERRRHVSPANGKYGTDSGHISVSLIRKG